MSQTEKPIISLSDAIGQTPEHKEQQTVNNIKKLLLLLGKKELSDKNREEANAKLLELLRNEPQAFEIVPKTKYAQVCDELRTQREDIAQVTGLLVRFAEVVSPVLNEPRAIILITNIKQLIEKGGASALVSPMIKGMSFNTGVFAKSKLQPLLESVKNANWAKLQMSDLIALLATLKKYDTNGKVQSSIGQLINKIYNDKTEQAND